ncbi:archaea-specific SMC-related protein [Sulfolobus acidocaldarius]|uniref:Conserved Archaeal protein n=4 Tax=Sulfolobus acidocaldarius TaxID=2285 RepID=Q4JCK3_SULAC|nr:archaea-specific SMC-related protein [Sulfolobus acidocaldarius]AAY79476.1 conserved Archaeal protein [Sulfolobus acidocaldarius DSM 639]AGE70025.1 hypothetical protein SacN8_00220 [Sulfolobus acidocaldarius N8]AGE72300.1 hypothetical protein SacRon12I_00220 [Sulfolobus acidocaldarius Ron12/I]ALU29548.1 hypothetical protein ATY89_06035 [Sulfolobus acidocaldarius]ALU32278.1 hypothetical protein ATZ20_09060 [Sulfolobus acidocaldarius]
MQVRILNIGGINRELVLSLEKGITIYRAPNAYGKTSLSKALVSLLTNEITAEDLLNVFSDEGFVEIEMDGKKYFRRLKRIKNRILEEKNLIADDKNATLLSYFSPENPLIARIITGDENIEWFISSTSRIDELKRRRESLIMKLEEVKSNYNNLLRTYDDIKKIANELENINLEIERLEKEKENVTVQTEQTIKITRQNRIVEIRERIQAKIKELKEKETKIQKLTQELEELKGKANIELKDKLTKEIQEIDRELDSLINRQNSIEIEQGVLTRILQDIQEAERIHSSMCPVCGSKVEPDLWKVRFETVKKDINELDRTKNDIINNINKKKMRRSELLQKVKEIERTEELIAQKSKALENLNIEASVINRTIEALQKQLKSLEERVESTYEVESKDNDIDKRIEELRKRRSDLELQLQQLGIPKKVAEEIESLKKQIDDINKQIDDINREYIRRLTVVKEEFETLSNSILKELEFNYTAEIDEKYRLVIKKDGVTMELRRLSTSEKTTLALILILVGLKEYFKAPFFIIDESFMTFDQKRFSRVLKYLNGIVDYVIITKSDETLQVKTERLLETRELPVLS